MRAWLFVLAVLVTFHKINQVASTEEARSSSTNNLNNINNLNSNINNNLDNNNNINNHNNNLDNNNNIKKDETRGEKPDPSTLVEIEKHLLSLFGFKNRPKIDRSKVVIPEAMKQLYAEIMGKELDSVNIPKPGLNTKTANTVRSFTHEESTIDKRFQHHHRFRLHFNVSNIPKEELLKAAELRLSRNAFGDADLRRMRHQIDVYDILRPGIKGKREPIFLLIDTKTVKINGSEPVSLDVVPAVERWLKTPKQNYGLLVHISTPGRPNVEAPSQQHIRLRRSVDENHETWAQNQPLLFTYTDDGRYKQRSIRDALAANRARRAPARRAHRRKDGREICQRRPLQVDFTDVGWSDWIVAPPGYEAFYCHGECQFPLADHLNSTNHAVVQTLVNSFNPNLAPRACCVPTQLTSVSMLYLDDENKVVLKNYQDMTVVGCGCR